MRKTWETINELIGKRKNTIMDIEELIINQGGVDNIVTSRKDVAEELITTTLLLLGQIWQNKYQMGLLIVVLKIIWALRIRSL